MRTRIEKALFINTAKDFKNDADRIYFGNEFCQNRIPSLPRLKEFYSFVREKDKGFTFVSPFVTDGGLDKLKGLLAFLDAQGDAEVVFNDWGVFALLKSEFSNLKPVMGRLLTKQRRDPRVFKILSGQQQAQEVVFEGPKGPIKDLHVPQIVPGTLVKHYQGSLINVPILQEFLFSRGIGRIEVDNLIWEMDLSLKDEIGASIYLPYNYITVSRMCGKLTLTYESCHNECQKYFFQIKDDSLPVPFYGIGNAIFYKTKRPSDEYLKKLGIDRIVYQPYLPY